MIRLDKYLADMGIGTRSEVKKTIQKKSVTVNGKVIQKPEQKIEPTTDEVRYKGNIINYEPYVYYMFHKPKGCVSATKDNVYPTVISYIDNPKGYELFPVGRLDVDTEGLLLITNDGVLAHELLSPKKHVEKTYYAKIDKAVTKEDVMQFAKGVDIGEAKSTLPSKLKILHAGETSEIQLTITEGKFHQVKRMFEAVGKQVTYLKRISMGNLQLDESLAPGEYRELTAEEIQGLKER